MEDFNKEELLKPKFSIPTILISYKVSEQMTNAINNWEEYKRQIPIIKEKIINEAVNGLRENFDDLAIIDYYEDSIVCRIDFRITSDQLDRIKKKGLVYSTNDDK